MQQTNQKRGFSLIELLVVMAIVAILAAVTFPVYSMAINHAHFAGCTSHMRVLGTAFMLYANDHDAQLPGRAIGTGTDKWPVLLLPYVQSTTAYVDPGDPAAVAVSSDQLASNTANNSSFFFNGFNDLGFYSNPGGTVTMPMLTNAGTLLLLGQKIHGNTQYYMDFVEGNEDDILAKTSYFGGSNYTFADGSVQFMKPSQYSDTMWLVNKDYAIPPIPAGH